MKVSLANSVTRCLNKKKTNFSKSYKHNLARTYGNECLCILYLRKLHWAELVHHLLDKF